MTSSNRLYFRYVTALLAVACTSLSPANAQLECADMGDSTYCWDPSTAEGDYTLGGSGWGIEGESVETLRFDSDGGKRGAAKIPEDVDFTALTPPSFRDDAAAAATGTELGHSPDLVTHTTPFSDFDWPSTDASICLGGTCQIGSVNGLPPFWVPNATGEPRPPAPDDNLDQQQQNKDDPVNPANGEFVVHATDLKLPSFGVRYAHQRTYRSRVAYDGPLGFGWDHAYNQRIVPMAMESCQGEVLYMAGGGSVIRFSEVDRTAVYNAQWNATTYQVKYQAPAGVDLELDAEVVASGQPDPTVIRQWTLRWPTGIVAKFGTEGLIASLKDWNGQGLTFEWMLLEIPVPEPDPAVAEALSTLAVQITDPADPEWDPVTGFETGPEMGGGHGDRQRQSPGRL